MYKMEQNKYTKSSIQNAGSVLLIGWRCYYCFNMLFVHYLCRTGHQNCLANFMYQTQFNVCHIVNNCTKEYNSIAAHPYLNNVIIFSIIILYYYYSWVNSCLWIKGAKKLKLLSEILLIVCFSVQVFAPLKQQILSVL